MVLTFMAVNTEFYVLCTCICVYCMYMYICTGIGILVWIDVLFVQCSGMRALESDCMYAYNIVMAYAYVRINI